MDRHQFSWVLPADSGRGVFFPSGQAVCRRRCPSVRWLTELTREPSAVNPVAVGGILPTWPGACHVQSDALNLGEVLDQPPLFRPDYWGMEPLEYSALVFMDVLFWDEVQLFMRPDV